MGGLRRKIMQRIRKNNTSFKDQLIAFVLAVIASIIAGIIIKLFETYKYVYNWLSEYKLTNPYVLIPVFIVSVALFILATASWWYKERKNVKLPRAIPPVLFLCSVILMVNIFFILFVNPPEEVPIASYKMNPEKLWEEHTADLPIQEPYQGLALQIKCPEGESLSLFPDFELEKISPLEGDWVSVIEEYGAEKLVISGLEAAKPDDIQYISNEPGESPQNKLDVF